MKRSSLFAAAALLLGACGNESTTPPPAPIVLGPPVPCAGKPWSDEVCIPGGDFVMGHDPLPYTPPVCTNPTGSGNNNCGPGSPPPTDFTPAHKVTLSAFFLDVFPATNGDYLACLQAGQCPEDCVGRGMCGGGDVNDVRLHDPRLTGYPAVALELDGAEAYCRWKGKRLPTEAEWERAARGRQGFDYPWGNEPPSCANTICDQGPPPFGWLKWWVHPVGANKGDVSPDGVHEMVTGTQELLHDIYDNRYYQVQPEMNPQGPRLPPGDSGFPHSIRGNSTLGAVLFQYNGVLVPMPAWARGSDSAGGVRCARSDGTAMSEGFAKRRQRALTPRVFGSKP